jgi:hypothetical protein
MYKRFAYLKNLCILLYIVCFDNEKKMRITYKDYPLTLLKIILITHTKYLTQKAQSRPNTS